MVVHRGTKKGEHHYLLTEMIPALFLSLGRLAFQFLVSFLMKLQKRSLTSKFDNDMVKMFG